MVFDSRDDGEDRKIASQMKNWLFRSHEGQAMDALVHTAFFVSSKVEEGIQLADLVAGIIRMYHERRDSDVSFLAWIDELYATIKRRTMTLTAPAGTPLYGIYSMPARHFYEGD